MKDHNPFENATTVVASASTREHQQVWESLPWLANGTANADQRRRAAAHLAECADCRGELEVQRRLQRAVVEAQPQSGGDAEPGLQRLLERLEAPSMEQPLPSPPATAPRREASRLTLALAVAVVVQAIGLGVLGAQAVRGEDAVEYRMLSQQRAPLQRHASLQVVPASSMTMADWQHLLHVHHLRVVDGPNEAGSYALASADPAAVKSADALLQTLRATPGVRLAEPIAPVE